MMAITTSSSTSVNPRFLIPLSFAAKRQKTMGINPRPEAGNTRAQHPRPRPTAKCVAPSATTNRLPPYLSAKRPLGTPRADEQWLTQKGKRSAVEWLGATILRQQTHHFAGQELIAPAKS